MKPIMVDSAAISSHQVKVGTKMYAVYLVSIAVKQKILMCIQKAKSFHDQVEEPHYEDTLVAHRLVSLHRAYHKELLIIRLQRGSMI